MAKFGLCMVELWRILFGRLWRWLSEERGYWGDEFRLLVWDWQMLYDLDVKAKEWRGFWSYKVEVWQKRFGREKR